MGDDTIVKFTGATIVEVPARQCLQECLDDTEGKDLFGVLIILEDSDGNIVLSGNRTDRNYLVALCERAKLQFLRNYNDG